MFSIGCGCGVDYYGLDHALRYHPKYAPDLRYTGIDIVRWKYRDTLGRDEVYFVKKDIADWNELDETGYNIIMFPKSIGEFPSKVFTHIKKMLKNSTFERDRICLACSLMDRGKDSDITRFADLARVMTETHGFTTTGKPNEFWHFKKDQGIRGLHSDWIYPNDTLDYIKELARHCPTFEANGESCRPDCDALNRWPILKTGRIAYQALGLQRD